MKELVIKGRGPNGFKRGAFMDKYDVRTHSRGLYRKSKTLLVARVPRTRSKPKESHSAKRSSRRRSPSPYCSHGRAHRKSGESRSPSPESRSTSADSNSTKSSSCSSSPSPTRRNRGAHHKRNATRSPSANSASTPSKSISSDSPGILHLLHLAALQSSQFPSAPFNSLEDEKRRTEMMLIELEKGNQAKLAIQMEL
ncbi:unnamed protein product [Caenorhabditis brenneri]